MTENYIQIMIESLEKKIGKLDNIIEKNKEQAEILKENEFSVDDFDRNVEEKAVLIEELSTLDIGFEQIYKHVKEELSSEAGKLKYSKEIKKMQELISLITEKSVSIQAQESRNKQLVEQIFRTEKEKIRSIKRGAKAAVDYYRNMNHTNYVAPHFVDKKN